MDQGPDLGVQRSVLVEADLREGEADENFSTNPLRLAESVPFLRFKRKRAACPPQPQSQFDPPPKGASGRSEASLASWAVSFQPGRTLAG
jgi:hypothetical protein